MWKHNFLTIFELVKYINSNTSGENSKEYIDQLYKILKDLTDIMGIIIEKEEEGLDAEVEALIAERQAARKAKDFAKADAIRDQLLAMGIIIKDTREGVTWKRA